MAQQRLALPPAERRRVINRLAWIAGEGETRTVVLNYVPFATYQVQDRPTERYLVGCLAQAGVGTKVELARAFGCHRNHVAHLAQLAQRLAARRALPTRVRLSEAGPAGASEALRLEKKAILDALKCCAYQAEEWLLTRLRPHYRNPHDVRARLRVLSQAKGALAVEGDTLTVELEPLSPPQFHHAAAGFCAELNALGVTLPHANLKLRYRMAEPVHTTGIRDAA